MTLLVPLLLAGALAASPEEASAPAAPPSPEEWFDRFYERPRVDLLADMVARLDADGLLAKPASRPPITAFLSIVLRRPDVRAEPLVQSAEVGVAGREVLLDALWWAGKGREAERIAVARGLPADRYRASPPQLLTMPLDDPSSLDVMWGAFLASGDTAYPRRLVDLLDLPQGARGDPARWIVLARSALWSLRSNARQHPRILGFVEEEAARRTGPAKELLDRIVAEHATPSAPPAPDPAPEAPMTRVVTRDVSPDLPKDSFARRPRTLYRLGEKYARLEEEPDPAQGIHGLIVVSEPQVWMINLADMTGQRIVDPGPSFVFHAPLLPPDAKGAKGPGIELGQEYEFLRAHRAKRRVVVAGGERLEEWSVTVDGHVITLRGRLGEERPVSVRIARKGGTRLELEYLDYQRDLPPRMELFVPPAGVRIRDAR